MQTFFFSKDQNQLPPADRIFAHIMSLGHFIVMSTSFFITGLYLSGKYIRLLDILYDVIIICSDPIQTSKVSPLGNIVFI